LTIIIVDIEKFLVENFDAEESLAELAQAGLRQAILSLTLEEIDSGRVKLDNRLTKEAQSTLENFGVEVESMRLQSCAEGTVLIHAGSFISA
jgi:regulator of protease activity HflC (stomatin/prohibitin superfamily)